MHDPDLRPDAGPEAGVEVIRSPTHHPRPAKRGSTSHTRVEGGSRESRAAPSCYTCPRPPLADVARGSFLGHPFP